MKFKGPIGHTTNFDIGSFDFETPFFLPSATDYVPVLSILGDNDSYGHPQLSVYSDGKGKKLVKRLESEIKGLVKLNHTKAAHLARAFYGDAEPRNVAKAYKASIQNFLGHSGEVAIKYDTSKYSKTTYSRIFSNFWRGPSVSYYLQSAKHLHCGQGFIYHTDSKMMLMAIVVPTKLIKYQKLYYIFNGEFDVNGLEFWITRGLDSTAFLYKSFRTAYRKYLKPEVVDSGIRIVEKDNVLQSLIPLMSLPQGSINELEKWKASIAKGCLEAERKSLTIKF